MQMAMSEKHSETQRPVPQSIESLTTLPNQIDRYDNNRKQTNQEVDCASVTSSEWGAESEKSETTLQRHNASIKSLFCFYINNLKETLIG